MTFEDSIGIGLLLSVAFWAAAIGGIAALSVWALITSGWFGRNFGKAGARSEAEMQEAAATVSVPAEEGGQLDEWESDRLDRAA